MIIARLVFSGIRRDSVRAATAALGIGAAMALLVWTVGLTVATFAQGRARADQMITPFDCFVSTGRASGAAPKGSGIQALTRGSPVKTISPRALELIAASEALSGFIATAVFRTTIDYRPGGRLIQGPGLTCGMAPARDFPNGPPRGALVDGAWPDPLAEEPECALQRRIFTDRGYPAPEVGETLALLTPGGRIEARIAGFYEAPEGVSGFPTLFASDTLTLFALPDAVEPGDKNLVLCTLNPGADPAPLAKALRSADPDDDAARLVTRGELLQQIRSDATSNLSRQIPLMALFAMLTAACMLVNALCVGVEQRRLFFARLRCAGMTRGQLLRFIAGEGAFLALCGWGIGLLIGSCVLRTYIAARPDTFPDGYTPDLITPLIALILLAAVTAFSVILPARKLLRLRPVEALQSEAPPVEEPRNLRREWIGVAMMLPLLLLVIPFHCPPMARSLLIILAGIPLHAAGLIRALPLLIRGIERAFLPLFARCFGLDAALFRGIVSRAGSRTTLMVVTLAAGLGSYCAIHIWGASLMKPFVPSETLPGAIVSILPHGLASPPPGLMPFSANQYVVDPGTLARFPKEPLQNNILLLGVPTDTAFGAKPLIRTPVKHLAGETPAEALARGGCFITAMFARQSGLKPGDTLRLLQRDPGLRTLDLPIAGVMELNWHLVTARSRLRARNGAPFGTLGPVFVSDAAARAWDPANTETARFLWGDCEGDAAALEARVTALLPENSRDSVHAHLRDEIADGTFSRGAELIGDLARIPFWSLIILSFGIVTLLVASVRAERRTLAVMRAVGMTRLQLARLLLTQIILVDLCAIAASLLFGLCCGWTFTAWTQAWMPFGGLSVALVIPWRAILAGIGFTLLSGLAVAAGPVAFLAMRFTVLGGGDE